jgi:hypothetical protein
MSGFSSAGAGQLIGPNGNTMDTEEFLSGLNIFGVSGNPTTSGNTQAPYLFRVVTQRYGKGIVQYGSNVTYSVPFRSCRITTLTQVVLTTTYVTHKVSFS